MEERFRKFLKGKEKKEDLIKEGMRIMDEEVPFEVKKDLLKEEKRCKCVKSRTNTR